MNFPTDYPSIIARMEAVEPTVYGSTRNYVDGAVTYLSPYISRGVISAKQVYASILHRGFNTHHANKLIQELAWRDYWQQVWIAKGNAIDEDLKHEQPEVQNHQLAKAIVNASTGISAIDDAIKDFYTTGYLHNHMRMYLASLACNLGKSHWSLPARWMYYHLLDADWASNALSWQWVAGSNSNKKYYANQENVNTYFHTDQRDTFLDVPYEHFPEMEVPSELQNLVSPTFKTTLPDSSISTIDPDIPTLIYNFYNLDPKWHSDLRANRILLLEPSQFEAYPVGSNTIEFILELAKNIPDIQMFTGSFQSLCETFDLNDILYKEHPLTRHYSGVEEPRDWMFDVQGYFPSFFAFWKKCKRFIPKAADSTNE